MQNKKSRGRPRKKVLESKGLGDEIEKVTKATGVKKVVDFISEKTGLDCGCEKRKEILNELFPNARHRPKDCMTPEQHEQWTKVKDIKKSDSKEYVKSVYPVIAKLHSDIFNHHYYEPCTCSPNQWDSWRRQVELAYKAYDG